MEQYITERNHQMLRFYTGFPMRLRLWPTYHYGVSAK